MKPILTFTFSILAIAGTVLSTSCWDPRAGAEPAEVLEMRVYKVPEGQTEAVQSVLRSALAWGDTPVGRVSAGPGNTLVVVAPAEIHKGVADLIGKLDDVDTTPDLKQVTVSYWMIVGRPLAEAPSDGRGYVVEGDSSLAAVAPALEAIAETQGPTEFSLMEQIRITTLNSDRGRAHGRNSIVEQRLTDVDGRLTGDVQMIVGQNQLETRVALDAGQLLVMGQVGYRGRPGDVFETDGSSEITLYYVLSGE